MCLCRRREMVTCLRCPLIEIAVLVADDVIPQGVFLGALGALALIPPLIAARLVKHAAALARSQTKLAQPAPGLHGGKGVSVPSSDGAEPLRAEQTGTEQAAGRMGTHFAPEGSAGPESGGQLQHASRPTQEAQSWPEGAGSAHPGSLDKQSSNRASDRQSPIDHTQDPQDKGDRAGPGLANVLRRPLGAAGLAHLACALRLGSGGFAAVHGHAPSTASPAGLHGPPHLALSADLVLSTGLQAACWLALGCLAWRPWWGSRGTAEHGSRQERRIGACAGVAVTLALLTMHCTWLAVANWALAFLLLWLACPAIFGVMQLLLRPSASTMKIGLDSGVDEGKDAESGPPRVLSFSGQAGLVAAVAALGGLWSQGGLCVDWLSSSASAVDPTLTRVWLWLLASCAPMLV